MTGKAVFASHGTTDGLDGKCSIPVNKEPLPEGQPAILRPHQFASEFTGHGVNRYFVLLFCFQNVFAFDMVHF